MTTQPLPFAPGAARAFLIGNADFTALIPAASVTTRELPDPIAGPCMTITATVNRGVDPMLRRVLLQLDTWVPKRKVGDTLDPDVLAWKIAAMAGQLFGRAGAVPFEGSNWAAKWIEGPITAVDKTRGVDNPLYRAIVRVELKMRAPRA